MAGIDALLLAKCKDGDERALYQLYQQCYSLMKGICLRYVFDKEMVGEVINTGFLKIVNGLDKYDSAQPFFPWASTVVIRVAIDHVRKIMRSPERFTDHYEDLNVLNGRQYSLNEADLSFDAHDLLAMLDKLPGKTRVVFNLFAIDGYSHREIGIRLNITEGTSKWHVSKAREQLQKEIKNRMNQNKSDYEPSHR